MSTALNDKDKWLASEYAMGVLEGGEMRAAERRFETDPLFRQAVEDWQNQLTPMLDEVEPVDPPASVWVGVQERTGDASAAAGWWSSLGFWRGFSALSGGVAAAAVAALLFLPPAGLLLQHKPVQPLIATLTAQGQAPAFVARFDPETGALFVRAALDDKTEQRVAELWLIPGDGVPRSLGLLDKQGLGDLKLSSKNLAVFGDGATLAVSLEPEGGSPTGAPTGPVIASGKLEPI